MNKVDRVAVIKDSHERRTDNLIKKLKIAHKEQVRQDRLVMHKRSQQHKKVLKKQEKAKESKMKERKKSIMKHLGQTNKI